MQNRPRPCQSCLWALRHGAKVLRSVLFGADKSWRNDDRELVNRRTSWHTVPQWNLPRQRFPICKPYVYSFEASNSEVRTRIPLLRVRRERFRSRISTVLIRQMPRVHGGEGGTQVSDLRFQVPNRRLRVRPPPPPTAIVGLRLGAWDDSRVGRRERGPGALQGLEPPRELCAVLIMFCRPVFRIHRRRARARAQLCGRWGDGGSERRRYDIRVRSGNVECEPCAVQRVIAIMVRGRAVRPEPSRRGRGEHRGGGDRGLGLCEGRPVRVVVVVAIAPVLVPSVGWAYLRRLKRGDGWRFAPSAETEYDERDAEEESDPSEDCSEDSTDRRARRWGLGGPIGVLCRGWCAGRYGLGGAVIKVCR